jgi:hypothetical protein
MKNKKGISGGSKEVIGLGVAAMAAATAGAYYLYGSAKGKAHRSTIKSWMLHAKAEVMSEIEKMKEVNEGAYKDAVAKVTKKYKAMKGMDRTEIAALATTLHGHWKDILREIEKAGATSKVKHLTSSRRASKKKK